MKFGVLFAIFTLVTVVYSADFEDEDMLLYWRRNNVRVPQCKPFTTYRVDCNKCVCSADGTEYCTKMFCMKPNLVQFGRPRDRLSLRRNSVEDSTS